MKGPHNAILAMSPRCILFLSITLMDFISSDVVAFAPCQKSERFFRIRPTFDISLTPPFASSYFDGLQGDGGFFANYNNFIDDLDASLPNEFSGCSDSGVITVLRKASVTGRRPRGKSCRNKNKDNKEDAEYDMFLSNLEKDMIEGWRKETELSSRKDAPSNAVAMTARDYLDSDEFESGNDSDEGCSTEDFLSSLSTEQLQERLREAGLPVMGGSKAVLVNRLMGKELTQTETFLAKLTVPQLKERLREAGLPLSGKKADLINRLLGN